MFYYSKKNKNDGSFVPYHLMQFQKLKHVVTIYLKNKLSEKSKQKWRQPNLNLFFDKKEKKIGKYTYGQAYISMVCYFGEKKGLCIGMAWLPFQKV